jgi:hypothetical protein
MSNDDEVKPLDFNEIFNLDEGAVRRPTLHRFHRGGRRVETARR